MSVIRFNAPRFRTYVPDPPLLLTGTLPGYNKGAAYSGYLTITNSIGKCRVELVEGNLPPGYTLFVDNVLKRVVLRLPAFVDNTATVTTIHNHDLELGDDGWDLGQGWSVITGFAKSGTHSLRFLNYNKPSTCWAQKAPCVPGRNFSASCFVHQGASAAKNAKARVCVRFLDASGNQIGDVRYGGWVESSSGGWDNRSDTSVTAPAGTLHAQIGVQGDRRIENKALHADLFSWSNAYVPGSDSEQTYSLRLRVTDGKNRVAYWEGTLGLAIHYVTSQLYTMLVDADHVSVTSTLQDVVFTGIAEGHGWEGVEVASSVQAVSYTLTGPLPGYGWEGVEVTSTIAGVVYAGVLPSYGWEGVEASSSIQSFGYVTFVSGYGWEGVEVTSTIQGVSYT